MKKLSLFQLIVSVIFIMGSFTLHADEIDEGFSDDSSLEEGFDDTSSDDGFDEGSTEESDPFAEDSSSSDDPFAEGGEDEESSDEESEENSIFSGFSGKITQQMALSYSDKKAQDIYSSLRSTLFLNYNHKFENDFTVKLTARAFYDGKYDSLNGIYTQEQIDELRTETRLFEAYLSGSIFDGLDFKIGRQIEAWGRSDTIRVNDILNPVDNRRPGLLDVEDLRLPRALAKLDYYIGDWRISPIVILENIFTEIPPYGSTYDPFRQINIKPPPDRKYDDFGYAISIGYEGSGWDLSLYGAYTRDDFPYLSLITDKDKFQTFFKDEEDNPFSLGKIEHEPLSMLGAAFNIVKGSWLLKSEISYFETGNFITDFSRFDMLFGFEYTGFSGIFLSYDVSGRSFFGFDAIVQSFDEAFNLSEVGLQHAFRINKDWSNATIHTSYMVFLYGIGFNEGGFQRVAVKYDLADGISANLGLVDYVPGSIIFNLVQDEYVIASDISYTF